MSDGPETVSTADQQAPAPPPEREPFWSYSDLALFIGLAFPCLLLSYGVVKGAMVMLHLSAVSEAFEAVAGQFVFYVLLFLALRMMLMAEYGRPFWHSLGWKEMRLPAGTIVVLGIGTAIAVAISSVVLRTPETPNQMTELMRDPRSLILIAIFGVTIAPVCEELGFRGFLQPLLVRSLGPTPGILLSAAAFGLLHFHEYGNSWRHAVVISLAGVGFGTLRHFTGSTKASALMHAAYNGFLFVALFSERKDLPHLW